MHLLYLSPRNSWPATSGARLRDFHFARALSSRSALTYLYFSDASAAELRLQLPSAQNVIAVRAPKRYTPGKILRGLTTRQPLPVQNYTSPEMSSAVESALTRDIYDVVHLDSIHLTGYLDLIRKRAPHARVVLDWHNVESELMARYADNSPSLLRRRYAAFTARSLQTLESRMLNTCYGHVVCSERERTQLSTLSPSARIAVVENGVDTRRFQPSAPAETNANRLIFVGQMSYHANVEGISWFVQSIWPAVLNRFPHLTLSIVGSDPSAAVRQLGTMRGVHVTGTVPDVLPYYQGALASIVPLWTGGGTRLKILEAMAAGAPVISTALGAEGLAVTNGADILMADRNPASWLAALDIASDPEKRTNLLLSGRQLACQHYDWEILGQKLADTYMRWSGDPK